MSNHSMCIINCNYFLYNKSYFLASFVLTYLVVPNNLLIYSTQYRHYRTVKRFEYMCEIGHTTLIGKEFNREFFD